VRSGDNLTKIARGQGQHTTADDVFEANRDKITNPNQIFPGQVLRIPLLRH
jgi:nucleoid-associated protein YgaU